MDRVRFEEIAEKAFAGLPGFFRERIENVQIVIEDYPSPDQLKGVRLSSKYELLGLYEGIPLEKRGVWYGSSPTLPDRISLFQKNIEAVCRSDDEIENKVREVLVHEIAHYFGMTEKQVRNAGF